MRYCLLILCCLVFISHSSAQIDRDKFHSVDSFVSHLGPMNDYSLHDIVDTLLKPCKDSSANKVRAIYYWVCLHIDFDTKNFHHQKQFSNSPSEVLASRKAISEGYASLTKAMCNLARIPCIIVNGEDKEHTESIGKSLKTDKHSWNIVAIDGRQYVLDACWGAGTTDEKHKYFKRNFTDAWFLTNRSLFALTHYPQNKKDQLLETPISKTAYTSAPIIGAAAVVLDVYPSHGMRGILKGKEDTSGNLIFEVRKPGLIQSVSVSEDGGSKLAAPYRIDGSRMTVSIPYKIHGDGDIDMYINNSLAYSFVGHISKKGMVKYKK